MKKIFLLIAIFILSASRIGFTDQAEQVITLKDGSQIKGVLSGIDKGVYTVKTPIIGDIHVAAADVASITNGNAPAVALPAGNPNSSTGPNQGFAAPPNLDQQIAASQQKLISNPQSMAVLQEMAQDPEIAQALQDPALIQAVTSHDYKAVQSNPGVQKLLSNPKMQSFIQQLAAQQQQTNSASQ